jgi:hypothetical protein
MALYLVPLTKACDRRAHTLARRGIYLPNWACRDISIKCTAPLPGSVAMEGVKRAPTRTGPPRM